MIFYIWIFTSFPQFEISQGQLLFCNGDYTRVCLCVPWIDSVRRWQCIKSFPRIPGAADLYVGGFKLGKHIQVPFSCSTKYRIYGHILNILYLNIMTVHDSLAFSFIELVTASHLLTWWSLSIQTMCMHDLCVTRNSSLLKCMNNTCVTTFKWIILDFT